MFERGLSRWVSAAALVGGVLVAPIVCADARSDAKAAYQRGVAAHKRGDEAASAHEFAAADAALPNRTALLAALQAVNKTDDASLAADLLERRNRETDPKVAEAAAAVEARFQDRLGWVRLECGAGAPCDAQLGERKLEPGADVRVAAGNQTLRIHRGETEVSVTVTVQPGSTSRVSAPAATAPSATAPAATAPTPTPPPLASAAVEVPPARPPLVFEPGRAKPLPPFVVYLGGAAAVAAGISGIAVIVHAGARATDFEDAGCTGSSPPAASDCKSRASTGRTLDVVGNALLLGGAALGLGTVLLSAFFVDWRGKGTVSAGPVPGGAVGAYRIEF